MIKARNLQYFMFFWGGAFLFGPALYLLCLSFFQKGLYGSINYSLTFENYLRSLDFIYVKIFFRSVLLASWATFLTLIVSIPICWKLTSTKGAQRHYALLFLCVPFFLNLIARIYSLKSLFSFDGTIAVFTKFVFGESLDLSSLNQNLYIMSYALSVSYLPYMVFPVFVAFEKMDIRLVEAVYDLGGDHWLAFKEGVFPQIKNGIATGVVLVFVPAFGEYLIPDLLGGAKNMLVGNLLTEQFLKSRDWCFGAALSVESILALFAVIFLIRFMFRGKNNRLEGRNQ